MGEGARRFIHLAASICRPVTHPPPPLRSLRAGPRQTRAETPVRASESPAHAPVGMGVGARSLRTRLSQLWHPGRGTPSIQPLSWWAGPEGGGDPSPPDWPRESLHLFRAWVSLSREGGSGSLPHTIRRGMKGGPQPPRADAAWAAGEGAVTQPPSARLPGTLQQLEPAVATGTESFCSPMSGLPGQEGGCHSQVRSRPRHTAHRLPAQQNVTDSSPPYPALHSCQSQVSSDPCGPEGRPSPNSDLGH